MKKRKIEQFIAFLFLHMVDISPAGIILVNVFDICLCMWITAFFYLSLCRSFFVCVCGGSMCLLMSYDCRVKCMVNKKKRKRLVTTYCTIIFNSIVTSVCLISIDMHILYLVLLYTSYTDVVYGSFKFSSGR